ncbi:YihY/virulence factor BrkB family protein [Natronomonas gomsonensis]|uniref:YihY/virulence factor BrkB family protein n=1 Tax=Natronomonas gomsonensis TaxID=1046043 RepID=UPI0020CA3401|nr:YihY/virulence factor BrkB family protein [Natronomonas gomsonensis]MCY4729844.1 YihY/virulence factor BrkB family protein [Natronomonas gomsonensis]
MYGSPIAGFVKGYLARVTTVTRGVVNGAQSDRITFIAGSLAYYAFISLLPLLLLALVAASTFGDAGTVEALVARATETLGEQAGVVVRDALTGATGRGGATLLGVAVLLWSGLKLFRGLDIAFSEVYGHPGPESIVDQFRNATVTLGAVGVAVAATVAVGALISLSGVGGVLEGVGGAGAVAVLGTLTLVAGLTAAFLPLYYLLPGTDVSVREALPGAVFAAVGWTLLQTGFRVYAEFAGSYEAYGVLGGVLLLLTFLYFGGLVLLLGVVLNAVLAGRANEETGLAESEEPTPEPTAVLEGIMTRDRLDDEVSDAELREELERLYDELDRFEERVDDRTVHREEIESDLKRYVRKQVRRGKARGWGPYLVLLYGTAMTLGAFVALSGGWAILAMLVIWLSTLGLYVLMLLVGTTATVAGLPGRLKDRLGDR